MFGHFVSDMLMLGYAEIQVFRRNTRYCMFHVEHLRGIQSISKNAQSLDEPGWVPSLHFFFI